MHRTNIYLSDDQCQALDRLAGAEGASRAEIIRRILDRALLGTGDELERDLRAIGASFGALRDGLSGPGARTADARSRHLDRLWEP